VAAGETAHTVAGDQAGVRGDPIFDTFFASVLHVPVPASPRETQQVQRAGAVLLDQIGPAIVVAHSLGCKAAWLWGDARPNLVKALIALEPTGLTFEDAITGTGSLRNQTLTFLPLTYGGLESANPVMTPTLNTTLVPITAGPDELQQCLLQADPPLRLIKLSRVPVLLVTGEASYHAVFDRGLVDFLRQAEVEVDWLHLGKEGIHGNGHMMFMEQNSDEIARALHRRILRTIKER